MKITWLGHATVAIETPGGRLMTDPVLRRRVMHLRRHAAAVAPQERVDAVLLSHLHHDHYDVSSLRRLGAPLIGPPGCSRELRRLGLAVRELRPGEASEVAGAEVTAVKAVHDGRRWPLGARSDEDAIGFVIAAEGQRIYFAGDTELFDGMRELGRLDVALVPIWGWGSRLGPGHMNPDEAARAVALLRPRIAVPIHWGTLLPVGAGRHLGGLLHKPGQVFAERVREHAPGVTVEVLAPGGALEL